LKIASISSGLIHTGQAVLATEEASRDTCALGNGGFVQSIGAGWLSKALAAISWYGSLSLPSLRFDFALYFGERLT